MHSEFTNQALSIVVAVIFAATGIAMISATATAGEMESTYARGGKLYDKWYQ